VKDSIQRRFHERIAVHLLLRFVVMIVPVLTGSRYPPRTFIQLYCKCHNGPTPHSAGRIALQEDSNIRIDLRCRRCGNRFDHTTSRLPDGYRPYHILVTGEDGPHLPAELRPLPYLEEEFLVVGCSNQDAYERAAFACELRFSGHKTTWYIDGNEWRDERF
jgi:hypothetical protein